MSAKAHAGKSAPKLQGKYFKFVLGRPSVHSFLVQDAPAREPFVLMHMRKPREQTRVAVPEPTTPVDVDHTPTDAPPPHTLAAGSESTPERPASPEEVTGLVERLSLAGAASNSDGAASDSNSGEGGSAVADGLAGCTQCGATHGAMKRCQGCHAVSYCSKECQKAGWNGGHKVDCQFAGIVARMDEANAAESWAAVVELGEEAEKDRGRVADKKAREKCMHLVFQALRAQDALPLLAAHMQKEAEQFHEFAMYEAEGMKLQNLGNLLMRLSGSNRDTMSLAARKCYERARDIAEQGTFLSLQSQSAVGMSDLADKDGRPVRPTLYTLHPTPYTLHPTPYTLHPTPWTLHPTPYTLDPTPYTL